MVRNVPQQFNIPRKLGPSRLKAYGSNIKQVQNHHHRQIWWKVNRFVSKPFMIDLHKIQPRLLLQRDMLYMPRWSYRRNFPDRSRWEKHVNGQRVTEDRYAFVQEGGVNYKVNWRLYSQRLQSELKAISDNTPEYTVMMTGVPIGWKKLDLSCALLRNMSVREAMAQGKLSIRKGHQIIYRCLEEAVRGAENKGLDKDKLRISLMTCWPGPSDSQVDIRSKGFYAWKTKKSSHLVATVLEDPDMVLPDRTAVPYSSLIALKKAGLYEEQKVIDVPAISSEEI